MDVSFLDNLYNLLLWFALLQLFRVHEELFQMLEDDVFVIIENILEVHYLSIV